MLLFNWMSVDPLLAGLSLDVPTCLPLTIFPIVAWVLLRVRVLDRWRRFDIISGDHGRGGSERFNVGLIRHPTKHTKKLPDIAKLAVNIATDCHRCWDWYDTAPRFLNCSNVTGCLYADYHLLWPWVHQDAESTNIVQVLLFHQS